MLTKSSTHAQADAMATLALPPESLRARSHTAAGIKSVGTKRASLKAAPNESRPVALNNPTSQWKSGG